MLNRRTWLGEFSYLALFETIVANSIAVAVAWKTAFLWQLIVSSCLSPFLLLRSRKSTMMTIIKLDEFEDWIDDRRTFFGHAAPFLYVLIAVLIKIYSTTVCFFKRPVRSIKQIPANYYNNVFSLSLRESPELVPGRSILLKDLTFRSRLDLYNAMRKVIFGLGYTNFDIGTYSSRRPVGPWLIFSITFAAPLALASLIVRFSVKSTAVVWLPLLWILYNADPGRDTKAKMKIAIHQPWFKVVMFYSIFVVMAFSAKIFLFVEAVNIRFPEQIGPFRKIGEQLLDPLNIPLWQVAGFTNAVLALIFYNEAKKHGIAEGSVEAWAPEWIRTEYSIIQTLRTTLSLYTIACFLYILIATGSSRDWPAVKFILFPW